MYIYVYPSAEGAHAAGRALQEPWTANIMILLLCVCIYIYIYTHL